MKKLSLMAVRYKVDNEGLGYAVQHYMSGNSIEDPELAELWDEAKDLLNKIEALLPEPEYD